MAGRDYNFPGKPYPSQTLLMNALYESMEKGNIGLFESPTGTGKTLALICASAKFLLNERTVTGTALSSDGDWVSAHAAEKEAEDKKYRLRDLQQTRKKREKNVLNSSRSRFLSTGANKGIQRKKKQVKKRKQADDERFMLASVKKEVEIDDEEIIFSDDEVEKNAGEKPPIAREDMAHPPLRILFATRTHSQLSQFIAEFRKTDLGANALKMNVFGSDASYHPSQSSPILDLPLSVVLFGSRKHMCVNDKVRALESSAAITEKCRELNDGQAVPKPSVGSKRTVAKRDQRSSGCEYRNKDAELDLRDRSIVQLHSVEDLDKAAREMRACPYYAARAAIDSNNVDIIGVPYSAVLHAPTREAVGLTIDRNTIVIFDEAHNLVDTVCDLNSCSVTRITLRSTLRAMERYLDRYKSRLTPTNLFSLKQLVTVARGLLKLLTEKHASQKARVLTSSTVLFQAKIDNVNMYNLVEFMKTSKLSNKLRGFIEYTVHSKSDQSKCSARGKDALGAPNSEDFASAFVKQVASGTAGFESFVHALADCPKYGRIAIYPDNAAKTGWDALARLNFFVLEPGALFSSAVKDAKAVLMLGGTLSPRAAIKDRLLKDLTDRSIFEFECDHVVPAENVCTVVCQTGPSNFPLEFTHRSRQNFVAVDELGRGLVSMITNVPGGVVVFFTSYDFLSHVCQRWSQTGIIASLEQRKPVFFESRGSTDVFSKFQAVFKHDSVRGAFLGAVMGGKLSEGINFSDALGRMVIIVGMPFANASNVEMAEVLRGLPGKKEQSELLTNACLTSVNQSIGRAVRHAQDYASIVLIDKRYARPRIQEKLPAFVRRNMQTCATFGAGIKKINSFFDTARDSQ